MAKVTLQGPGAGVRGPALLFSSLRAEMTDVPTRVTELLNAAKLSTGEGQLANLHAVQELLLHQHHGAFVRQFLEPVLELQVDPSASVRCWVIEFVEQTTLRNPEVSALGAPFLLRAMEDPTVSVAKRALIAAGTMYPAMMKSVLLFGGHPFARELYMYMEQLFTRCMLVLERHTNPSVVLAAVKFAEIVLTSPTFQLQEVPAQEHRILRQKTIETLFIGMVRKLTLKLLSTDTPATVATAVINSLAHIIRCPFSVCLFNKDYLLVVLNPLTSFFPRLSKRQQPLSPSALESVRRTVKNALLSVVRVALVASPSVLAVVRTGLLAVDAREEFDMALRNAQEDIRNATATETTKKRSIAEAGVEELEGHAAADTAEREVSTADEEAMLREDLTVEEAAAAAAASSSAPDADGNLSWKKKKKRPAAQLLESTGAVSKRSKGRSTSAMPHLSAPQSYRTSLGTMTAHQMADAVLDALRRNFLSVPVPAVSARSADGGRQLFATFIQACESLQRQALDPRFQQQRLETHGAAETVTAPMTAAVVSLPAVSLTEEETADVHDLEAERRRREESSRVAGMDAVPSRAIEEEYAMAGSAKLAVADVQGDWAALAGLSFAQVVQAGSAGYSRAMRYSVWIRMVSRFAILAASAMGVAQPLEEVFRFLAEDPDSRSDLAIVLLFESSSAMPLYEAVFRRISRLFLEQVAQQTSSLITSASASSSSSSSSAVALAALSSAKAAASRSSSAPQFSFLSVLRDVPVVHTESWTASVRAVLEELERAAAKQEPTNDADAAAAAGLSNLLDRTVSLVYELAVERAGTLDALSSFLLELCRSAWPPLQKHAVFVVSTKLLRFAPATETVVHAASDCLTELAEMTLDDSCQQPEQMDADVSRASLLFFAVCARRPHDLLPILFSEYCRWHGRQSLQICVHRVSRDMIKALGARQPDLLTAIGHFPDGAANLALHCLQTLCVDLDASELSGVVEAARAAFDSSKDCRFMIPVLTSRHLPRNVLLDALPQLLALPTELSKVVIEKLACSPLSPLSPTELLAQLHMAENGTDDMVGIRNQMIAIAECLSHRNVFTEKVLTAAISHVAELPAIPILFFRTVLQVLRMYPGPGMVNGVVSAVGKLVERQFWQTSSLWEGFLKTVQVCKQRIVPVLLRLPDNKLEDAINADPTIRDLILLAAGPSTLSKSQRALVYPSSSDARSVPGV